MPKERGTNHVETLPGQAPLQCVPYAREHSRIKITGDAYTWWAQAAGRYERGPDPAAGTVMVLYNYAGPQRGHVAVVRKVVSAREIRVDHANWLDDGAIYVNDPVVDVSAANDWSQVRVWNIKTGGWGSRIYPVQGFIGAGSNEGAPADDAVDDGLMASDDTAPRLAPMIGRVATVRAAPPQPARSSSPLIAVSAGAGDLNPPADSPHALSADDLALP
jgi:surface antigen